MTPPTCSGWAPSSGSTQSASRRRSPTTSTERHIRERRARGLFGAAAVHDGAARGLVPSRAAARRRSQRRLGGALLLRARAPSGRRATAGCRATPGTTATRSCARSSTRSAARSARRTACSSTRTSTSTARPPRAPGVGFYGKNTMLITRAARLLGRARHARHRRRARADAAARRRLRLVHALHRRLPDRRARRARRRSTRRAASRTGRRSPEPIPEAYRAALGAQVYGCDICQDVCPWNRGVERRRADEPPDDGAHVDLVAWLGDEPALDETCSRRLYVPRNDPRWLRRNALVALGNTGGRRPSTRARAAAPRRRRRRAARRARDAGRSERLEERCR